TGASQILAQHPGADDRLEPRDLVRRPQRRATQYDGIVAVIDGFHIHHWFLAHFRAVVPHPFSEGAFELHVTPTDEALQDDLGLRRDRQSCDAALDDVHR